jgi:hypothetical protein
MKTETQKISYGNSTQSQKDFIKIVIQRDILACQSSLIEELLKEYILYYEDIQNLYLEGEDDPQEIFEWYLIDDDYIANKLIELREPVIVSPFGRWWGRTCTGQSIILDPTFWTIYQDQVTKE